MGSGRLYNPEGGFSEYLYTTVGEAVVINGYRCKIIKKITDTDDYFAGLPNYSNSSDIYIGLGPGGVPRQMKLYKDRLHVMDFDWGHKHANKGDGKVFPQGIVHVHRYSGANGGDARYMTSSERKEFGDIIHFFAPGVKLSPND